MSTLTLRLLLLVIHISGLVLIAGTTITGFVVFRAFISKAKNDTRIIDVAFKTPGRPCRNVQVRRHIAGPFRNRADVGNRGYFPSSGMASDKTIAHSAINTQ